jgi:hypothetical protein
MEGWVYSLITRKCQPFVVCDWKHLRVMRLNPQPSMVCDCKHLRAMRLNPQPSGLWLETLTCNETKSSAFRVVTGNTYSSHKPRKAEDLVSLHVNVSSNKPRKTEDLVSLHVSGDWKHLRVMRLNPQPSVLWLETLTCNETKSSALRFVPGNTYM